MHHSISIHQGIHQMVQGGFDDAAQWALTKLLEDYPDYAAAHNDLAVLAYDSGDFKTALKHYRRAAQCAPDNFSMQKNLGDFLYTMENEPEAALNQYVRALTLNPEDVATQTLAGHICVALQRFEEAENYYLAVLKRDPSNNIVQNCLNSLEVRKKPATPDISVEVLYQKATAMLEQGDRDGAEALLKQVLGKDPDFAEAHNALGIVAFEDGDTEDALRHYEKAVSLAPENIVFQKNMADFHFLIQGQPETALKRYIKVLSVKPDDVEALMGCGQICIAVGRPEDARDFFERVLDIEPWNNEAQRLINELEAPRNEDDFALPNAINEVCFSEIENTDELPNDILGLEELVKKQPARADAFNVLGVLYYEVGKKEKSLQAYEKAVALQPNNDIYRKNLADFYFIELERAEAALKIYVPLLEKNPRDEHCLLAAGMICMSLDKTEDAQTFFRRLLEINPWHHRAKEAMVVANNVTMGQHRAQVIDFNKQMAI